MKSKTKKNTIRKRIKDGIITTKMKGDKKRRRKKKTMGGYVREVVVSGRV